MNDNYVYLQYKSSSIQAEPERGPANRFKTVSLCLFSGDAWLYCVSKNEWKSFKHGHTESPRYSTSYLTVTSPR